jgi:hypothetical protein
MRLTEHYRRIRYAGIFTFWFGIIQLIFTPAYLTASLAIGPTRLFLAAVLYLTSSTILIMYGRSLKTQFAAHQAGLQKCESAKRIINWTIFITVVVSILIASNFALLLVTVALAMRWVTQSIRALRHD